MIKKWTEVLYEQSQFKSFNLSVTLKLKSKYLQWVNQTKPIKEVRELFDKLSVRMPTSLPFYTDYVKIEQSSSNTDNKRVKTAFEHAITYFGKTSADLWLTYLNYLKQRQSLDFMTISRIHSRALHTLETMIVLIFQIFTWTNQNGLQSSSVNTAADDYANVVKKKKPSKRNFYLSKIKWWIKTAFYDLDYLQDELRVLLQHQSIESTTDEEIHRGSPASRPMKPLIITRDLSQSKVFSAGYPSMSTMTIDEFYESFSQRGLRVRNEKVLHLSLYQHHLQNSLHQCNSDPNCGGIEVTTDVNWHNAYDVNGQTVMQLFAVGTATSPNSEWSFYNKPQPTVVNSIGDYAFGGEGIIHVTSYNCNSNPKNRVSGYCILTIPDALTQCNSDPNCGGIEVTTNVGWHNAYDVNGQTVVQLFAVDSATTPNSEWNCFNKHQRTVAKSVGNCVF
ncbi:unnamed protein product [Rotaria magnacalcarata]|uniref:U3 small nucleolar RNA-associated protein 6 homolog C-terminal domain-containing protein n=1 Tax=Rotaria magnacalcarata TaxID=392030 RepID=A0A816N783_9BILA|nr:unnamed protein product [Rotaria magnacalcarata]